MAPSASSSDKLSDVNGNGGNGKKNYGSFRNWWQVHQPSRCSTDSPTKDSNLRGSYQAIKTNDESCASLELGGNTESESLYENNGRDAVTTKSRKLVMWVSLMIIVMALFAVTRKAMSGHNEVDDGTSLPFPLPPPSDTSSTNTKRRPLSTLHPVHDLGLPQFARPEDSRPPKALTKGHAAADGVTEGPKQSRSFPTNAWYQNMLLVRGEPTAVNRAYATPFLVDAVGPIPGLRVHPNHVDASTAVVQLNTVNQYGLTVGAAPDAATSTSMLTTSSDTNSTSNNSTHSTHSNEYSVENMTPLGLTLAWRKSFPMTSSIVKGMPYGTMKYDAAQYQSKPTDKGDGDTWYPTVASEISLASDPIVDGTTKLTCHGGSHNNTSKGHGHHRVTVEREIELHFAESDFTWLVFVSRPVTVQCVDKGIGGMQLQVVDTHDHDHNTTSDKEPPFFIRIALTKFCTSNSNAIYCHHEQMIPYALNLGQGRYDDLLRNHSNLIPGPKTSFDYVVDQTRQEIKIMFDWDVKDMRSYHASSPVKDVSLEPQGLIVFALPHHLDLMGTRNAPGYLKYCASTLIGPACLLSGSQWTMVERLPTIEFRAPRPPAPWAIQALAKSAQEDIRFRLPIFYRRGAGDTYFSGKMLAKFGRVLTIVEELKELCGQGTKGRNLPSIEYKGVCRGVKLPSDRDVNKAVAALRSSVEVWLNGKAVTPFVYDDAWGGVVSCGCDNPDGGDCRNKFPDCPAFLDPGLNFGNAFYNDLHFHYGYHIYAAAVVSHFDPNWGKQYFERVLLLIRNIANPSYGADFFPAFRHKDWYQGHSWASGVVPPYLNGRNQESSSEAIAAYEAVALYGAVMTSVWENEKPNAYIQVAKSVQEAGQVLTATELRSTRRYYHVRDEGNANQALKIYPSEYNNHAIGMMWNTMAQYQTWFGGKPYLAVGIQLIPITPIAELRDGVQWLTEMYPSFANTCAANKNCEKDGWSVLQLASLATIGHQRKAAKDTEALSSDVFASAGGNGHSRTNTLWYIATRSIVDEPVHIGNTTKEDHDETAEDDVHVLSNCFRPDVCTDYVLDTIADEYSCRQRMTDLMYTKGHTQEEACVTVAKIQFPKQCGACDPNGTDTSSGAYAAQCPPCTVGECQSALNRCPKYRQTFVCTHGPNMGGCSRFPWDIRSTQCKRCCELTECAQKSGLRA